MNKTNRCDRFQYGLIAKGKDESTAMHCVEGSTQWHSEACAMAEDLIGKGVGQTEAMRAFVTDTAPQWGNIYKWLHTPLIGWRPVGTLAVFAADDAATGGK